MHALPEWINDVTHTQPLSLTVAVRAEMQLFTLVISLHVSDLDALRAKQSVARVTIPVGRLGRVVVAKPFHLFLFLIFPGPFTSWAILRR
jgi:hypothetical protein